jgi:hypothetical protein
MAEHQHVLNCEDFIVGVSMKGEIFISYRRDDSAGTTGRIFDRLTRSFPREKVFMDVDAAMHGLDFVRVLDEKIAASDIVVVVIGPSWLTAMDASGSRRVDNDQDFVRIEVAAALRREIPVIPVLVDGASMPAEADLPSDLNALARRHAVELRNTRFGDDADTLVEVLTQRLGHRAQRRWVVPTIGAGIALAAASFLLPQTSLFPNSQQADGTATIVREAPGSSRDAQRKAAAEAEEKRAMRERLLRLETERSIREEYEAKELQRRAAEQRAAEERRRIAEERARAEAEERAAEQTAAEERRRIAEEERRRAEQEAEQRRASSSGASTCDRLWHQRNSIYHNHGYCFESARGIAAFGNANCFRDQDAAWRAMGERNRQIIRSIQMQERANAC